MSYVQPSAWPVKDPGELLDYDIDWSPILSNDTIVSSTWLVGAGSVVIATDQFTNTSTKVWLSGGALLDQCLLTNTVTTTGGRIMDRSVKLNIKAK